MKCLFTFLFTCLFSLGLQASTLERGKALYDQICFNCHGPQLDGGIGPALNDDYWRHGSSPDAILHIIDKGAPGSEMIGYESVFSEDDRLALRDFIVSHQEGLRETLRSLYPRSYFKNKRPTLDLFDSVESTSQTLLPENLFYADRNEEGVLRGQAKLYLKEAGEYRANIRVLGRTSVHLNGTEIHYSDDSQGKKAIVDQTLFLPAGVHDLEILHEEKPSHSYRFHGSIQNVATKKNFPLNGRSLQGNIPKVIGRPRGRS